MDRQCSIMARRIEGITERSGDKACAGRSLRFRRKEEYRRVGIAVFGCADDLGCSLIGRSIQEAEASRIPVSTFPCHLPSSLSRNATAFCHGHFAITNVASASVPAAVFCLRQALAIYSCFLMHMCPDIYSSGPDADSLSHNLHRACACSCR